MCVCVRAHAHICVTTLRCSLLHPVPLAPPLHPSFAVLNFSVHLHPLPPFLRGHSTVPPCLYLDRVCALSSAEAPLVLSLSLHLPAYTFAHVPFPSSSPSSLECTRTTSLPALLTCPLLWSTSDSSRFSHCLRTRAYDVSSGDNREFFFMVPHRTPCDALMVTSKFNSNPAGIIRRHVG